MKNKIDENQKITLTLGQLKKLIGESVNGKVEVADDRKFTNDVREFGECLAEAFEYVSRKREDVLGDVLTPMENIVSVLGKAPSWQFLAYELKEIMDKVRSDLK